MSIEFLNFRSNPGYNVDPGHDNIQITMNILRIALPTPLHQSFDYLADDDLPYLPVIGARVKVPFGKRQLIGIIIAIDPPNPHPNNKLKPIIELIDQQPIFDQRLLDLLIWASEYYHHALGEVFSTALPKKIRQGVQVPLQSTPSENPTSPFTTLTNDRILTPDQQSVLDCIKVHEGFGAFLIEGVTGSGKTEIYLQLIAAQKKQALILVPEISLTPQTIQRFQERFNLPMAILHSGMTDKKRYEAWICAKTGSASIIIGTRSAIFTPMVNLGIIIIDEEHDPSLKQQTGFRYHARDIAIKRAQALDIPIILGSATPSLESLYNAQQGKFQHLQLTSRPGGAKVADWQLVDLRQHPANEGLSLPSVQMIKEHLSQGNQVLVFRNRRGFASVLFCPECRWISSCNRCSSRMTIHHHPKHLQCHHCGKTTTCPKACPDCQQGELVPLGTGTVRLEEALQQLFPDVNIARIDRDSTRLKGSLIEHLDNIANGKSQLLIGTQMLAKGHHFPNLTLVVLVDFDEGLFSSDFRASERMAQLLLQVAGRAGRAEKPGQVLIQTNFPEQSIFQEIKKQSYSTFCKQMLNFRQMACLPPFRYSAILRAEAVNQHAGKQFLQQLKSDCESLLNSTDILGPSPMPLARKAGRYRWQLLLLNSDRRALHQLLSHITQSIQPKSSLQVRWSLEVEPLEC